MKFELNCMWFRCKVIGCPLFRIGVGRKLYLMISCTDVYGSVCTKCLVWLGCLCRVKSVETVLCCVWFKCDLSFEEILIVFMEIGFSNIFYVCLYNSIDLSDDIVPYVVFGFVRVKPVLTLFMWSRVSSDIYIVVCFMDDLNDWKPSVVEDL